MIRTIFKAMGKLHLDVSLPHKAGYIVRIIERPGQWMDADQQSGLRQSLAQIANRAAPQQPLTYGVFAKGGFDDTIITLITDQSGTPRAFNALALMQVKTTPEPTDVLHLGLVMIDPEARSQNLSWALYGLTCFFIFLRRQMRPIWVSNVTQVPAVVGMVDGMFSDVWPAPKPPRHSLKHRILARLIMQNHRHVFGVGADAGYDTKNGIITDAYTGGSDGLKKTFAQTRQHRDDAVNDFCADALDYGRGDDLLQLGRMDMAAMRVYLSRIVPRAALAGLLVAGGIAVVQRILLPVVHWFDASQTWSILRPSLRK